MEVWIRLDERFALPERVQLTRVAIADVDAITFNRSGEMIRAWFDIPATMQPGIYDLIVEFPGRDQRSIVFRHPFEIR